MVNYELKNKRALITGGSHGIGLAIAKSLASEGVHVAICSRSDERLNDSRKILDQFDVEVITIKIDVLNDSVFWFH